MDPWLKIILEKPFYHLKLNFKRIVKKNLLKIVVPPFGRIFVRKNVFVFISKTYNMVVHVIVFFKLVQKGFYTKLWPKWSWWHHTCGMWWHWGENIKTQPERKRKNMTEKTEPVRSIKNKKEQERYWSTGQPIRRCAEKWEFESRPGSSTTEFSWPWSEKR